MTMTISEAATETGLSADTLRYYEKIRLLPAPGRTSGGKRIYRDQDIARLRFIRRAQAVGFSLEEIGKLLSFRENPKKSGNAVRRLAAEKHGHVRQKLELLQGIETELALLLDICQGDADTCPILTTLDGKSSSPSSRGRNARTTHRH